MFIKSNVIQAKKPVLKIEIDKIVSFDFCIFTCDESSTNMLLNGYIASYTAEQYVQKFIYFIKFWSYSTNLNGASTQKPSSLQWALMCIAFLRMKKLINIKNNQPKRQYPSLIDTVAQFFEFFGANKYEQIQILDHNKIELKPRLNKSCKLIFWILNPITQQPITTFVSKKIFKHMKKQMIESGKQLTK